MNRKFKFSFAAFVMILMLTMLLAACGGDDEEAEENTSDSGDDNDNGDELEIGQEDITIPYVAWARETISTEMVANLLEQAGYNVEVKQVEAGPMFSSVADGSADFHVSAWYPATHESYKEKYEDDLVEVNELIDSAPLALTVPDYVEDVDSIEDLKDNEEFGDSVDWKIIGIDPGAGIMQNTEKALEEYGLDDWELTSSSEAAMLTELQTALENEEPIIVPLWKPHWAFGDMDLKMLEDPKEVYGGEGDQIYAVANKDFEENAPRAYKILEQYDEDYEMLEEMMPKVYVDDEDPADVVQEFIDENPDRVDEWLDGIPTE